MSTEQQADGLQQQGIGNNPITTKLPPDSVDVILPAAGKSRRFSSERKKIFAPLGDRMVWQHAAERLRRRTEVRRIVIAIDPADRLVWEGECRRAVSDLHVDLVEGGAERADSVQRALDAIPDSQWIAVHDAARPLILDRDLDAVFAAASKSGAAILAAPIRGTVKRGTVKFGNFADNHIQHTVDRERLWEALTPQVFRYEIIRRAYQHWRGFPVTDDAQLVERMGQQVCLVEGSPTNLKITVADDLKIAAALLNN